MSDLPDRTSQNRIISDFISALNISRRSVASYPKGHRSIEASLARVMDLFAQIIESRQEVTFGITRDAMLFDDTSLDNKNPGQRDYSKTLFLHEIAALTFQEGLEADEILRFNEILGFKQEKIRKLGGIEQALAEANIRNILAKTSEYDQFRVIEKNEVKFEEEGKLIQIWENFVRQLLEGTLVSSAQGPDFESALNPEILARLMNEEVFTVSSEPDAGGPRISESISLYIRALFGTEGQKSERKTQLDRLSRFLRNLHPELRQKFLMEICDCLSANQEFAEEVFAAFPEEIIQETLETMNAQNSTLPPFLLRVLRKMGKRSFHLSPSPTAAMEGEDAEAEFELQQGSVLRDDDVEAPIPGAETAPTETISVRDMEDLEALKKSLDPSSMDLHLSTIVLEIFSSGVTAEKGESLKENLLDSCRYFLGTGDFGALHELHGRMLEYGQRTAARISPMEDVLSLFSQPEFMEEILDGTHIWGKEKYPEIQKLILTLGTPYIDPLLDHLAAEENLSIRYFFIDCLVKMGDAARDPILSRLYDPRWYFVRNLVLILRKLGNPSLPPSLRRLLRHPHAKVREEVLKMLLEFKDPDADRMLLADLAAKDKAVRLNAVILAENSKSRPIADRLVDILKKGDLLGSEMDLKKRIVQTLAKVGNPEILSDLQAILDSSSLIQRTTWRQLKLEIIRSLEFYPGAAASPLLERLSHAQDSELASLAALTLRNVRRNRS
jgi:HEAT repeat protein